MEQLSHFEPTNIFTSPDFRSQLNGLVDVVNYLLSSRGQEAGAPDGESISRALRGIPIRITGYGTSDGFYEFEEVVGKTDGDWGVKTGGLTHTELGEARGTCGWLDDWNWYPVIGRIALLKPGLSFDASGNRLFEFEVPGGGVVFPVKMTQTGGVAGDNDDECTFTYTVNDVDDNQLATGLNPASSPHTHNRPDPARWLPRPRGWLTTATIAMPLSFAWCGATK